MTKEAKAYRKRKERARWRHALALIDASPRRCDGCTACCLTHGVQELSKPYYRACQHQSEAGCAVHGHHPRSCQGFACAWRGGTSLTLDDERPDKIGIVVDCNPFTWPGASNTDKGWYCYEVWPGAADTAGALALFERLSHRYPTLIFRYGEPDKYAIHGFDHQGTRTMLL